MREKKTRKERKRNKNNKTKKTKIEEDYDIIILGGGIAGIYTIYQLTKNPKFSQKRILLLEKTNRLGGRVYSVHPYKEYPEDIIEAGAGRFSQNHLYLNKLIKELNLENKMEKTTSTSKYYPINREKESYDTHELLLKVIKESKKETSEYLRTISFLEYVETKHILSIEEKKYIEDSFGYYSELVIMNIYDAIQLINNLYDTFYILKGGLSQINERMVQYVVKEKENNPFQINQKVEKISRNSEQKYYRITTQNRKYTTKIIISALPKQVLEKIIFFKPIYPLLSNIKCAPLCRIYSRYNPNQDKIWFENLSKITTNNDLRMIIPINKKKGIIMMSYTDNKFADYWYNLYKKKGIKQLNTILKQDIQESTNIIIPREPIQTNIYYWKCGVGYWGIGANSKEISLKIINPQLQLGNNIFCCGEHYSEKFQQWMEGALETSEKVLLLLS
jgi:protoporphyrinogen oxidase